MTVEDALPASESPSDERSERGNPSNAGGPDLSTEKREDDSSAGEGDSQEAPARYSIGEVGERLDLESHVLRYWESEFDLLDPQKDAAGRRVYAEADIRAVERIQHLLKVEKYTIAGARRVLEREGIHGRDAYREELRTLRSFLVDVQNGLDAEPGPV